MCKKEKMTHGSAATGVPVPEIIASVALRTEPTGSVRSAYRNPLKSNRGHDGKTMREFGTPSK